MASAQLVGRTGSRIARNPQHSAIGPGNRDNGFDTDKLRSYGAARRQVMPEVEHWSHKGPNDRGELASARPSAVSKLICHSLDPAAPASNGAGPLPAQTLPVDHLDRHGLQTDIVEQPRI